ncbi:MAG: hypothetical protein AB1483_01615 [Candidatus Zixiibacteriota bacterium]
MHQTLRITLFTVLITTVALLISLGCSRDSVVEPTGSSADGIGSGYTALTTFVETFDNPNIEGNWSYFGNPRNRVEVVEKDGGNPGGFLHATCDGMACLDTYAPQLRTQIEDTSIFTGNYRAKGVAQLGVDLATFGPEIVTWLGRPLSLMIRYDGGTPYDWTDDVQVFYVGNVNIPGPNNNFRSFRFKVPSESTVLPDGWKVMYGYNTGDDDADWNTVMENVSQVTFFYGDPEYFFMFQQWELGVDNVSISYVE